MAELKTYLFQTSNVSFRRYAHKTDRRESAFVGYLTKYNPRDVVFTCFLAGREHVRRVRASRIVYAADDAVRPLWRRIQWLAALKPLSEWMRSKFE